MQKGGHMPAFFVPFSPKKTPCCGLLPSSMQALVPAIFRACDVYGDVYCDVYCVLYVEAPF